MAKYSNTVEYNIKTTLDSSGVTKLRTELQQLTNHIRTFKSNNLLGIDKNKVLADIKVIENALNKAFNTKLGMLNTNTFMSSIQKAGLSMNSIYKDFSSLGVKGQQAFTSLYGSVSKIDTGLRSVSSTTDKIMNTLGNTVRWGLIASGFSQIMNAAHQAAQYVQDLDKSLTNIMMVSGETRENMNAFAKSANEIAQRLGGTTTQMTEATKVFVQQGLSLEQSSRLAEYSVHLANVSEQDSATASDEITAYKNAFKIDLDDLGNAISKWAAVANNAAVSVEELSVASQKAASVATTVGVDMDQFAGHIAAIEATTREAPENIGNGLKTLYSRISDIKLGETLEDGVNLGQFTGALKKVGVEALDSAGELRDAGAIIEDIMSRWSEMSKTEQVATATTVAGRFQLARFMALMNSQDIYQNAVNVSRSETGTTTYDRMQETYRESLEGKSKALQASVEELFLNLFNSDSFNGAVDALTSFVNILNDLVESVGGGTTALTGLVAILLKLSSQSLSRGISNIIMNQQSKKQASENIDTIRQQAQGQLLGQGLNTNNQRLNNFANDTARVNQYANLMSDEQIRKSNELIEQRIQVLNELTGAEQAYKEGLTQLRTLLGSTGEENRLLNDQLAQAAKAFEEDGVFTENFAKTMQEVGFVFTSVSKEITVWIEKLEQGIQTQASWDELLGSTQHGLRNLTIGIDQLIKTEALSVEQTERFSQVLNLLSKEENLDNVSLQRFKQILAECQLEVNDVVIALEKAPGALKQVIANVEQAQTAIAGLNSQNKNLAGNQAHLAQGLNYQSITNNIISLGNAVMTATFALQSLSNIFNILNNEDLSIAEKAEQLAMNLAMVAVMGIPAITQTKTAIDGLKVSYLGWKDAALTTAAVEDLLNAKKFAKVGAIAQEVAAQGELNAETLSAAMIEEGYSKKTAKATATKYLNALSTQKQVEAETKHIIIEKLATSVANTKIGKLYLEMAAKLGLIEVTEGLTAAEALAAAGAAGLFQALLPLIAIATVIASIVTVINAASEAEERRQEALQGIIDTNNKAVNSIKENKDNLEELYNKYQDTGAASDEFKDALLEQAEALGIADAELYISANRYEALKDKIDEATVAQLNYNSALQQSIMNKASGITNLNSQEKAAIGIEQHQEWLADSTYGTSGGTMMNVSNDNNLKQLSIAQDRVNEISKQIAENTRQIQQENLKGTAADLSIINQLEQENRNLLDEQVKLQENLNIETNQAALDAQQQVLENSKIAILTDEDSQKMLENMSSISELETAIIEGKFGPELAEAFGSLGPEAAKEFLLQFVSEILNSNDIETGISQKQAQIASIITKDKNGNASIDSSKINSFDWSDFEAGDIDWAYLQELGFNSAQEFKEAFEAASKENPIKPTLDLESAYDFDSDEEINNYLENNTDIERSTLDVATSIRMEEHEPTGNRVDTWEQDRVKTWNDYSKAVTEADAVIAKYGEDSEEAAEATAKVETAEKKHRKSIEDTEKDTRLYEKAVQRAAAAEARQIKTIKAMNEHFEDNVEILQNADEGSIEYAEALEQTKEDLAGLLDIDADKLSNQFASSAETLDLMRESAEGNEEAFKELQTLAAQDLIDQIEIPVGIVNEDGTEFTTEYVQSQLNGLINCLNAQDLGIDVEAGIETQGWYDSINELLASGAITADQLTQVLSAAGYEGEITTEIGRGQVPQTTYTVEVGGTTNVGTDENPIMFPSSFTMTPSTTMVESDVEVPVLKGATQKGGVTNASQAANGRGGSGSGGSGGGGGSSKSDSKSVSATKSSKSEFDIYNKVNDQLDKLGKKYDEITNKKSRMYGNNYRKAAEQEINNLTKQNEKLAERNKITEAYIKAMQTGENNPDYGIDVSEGNLKTYGLTVGTDGTITNYKEVYQRLEAERAAGQKAADDYFKSKGGTFKADGTTDQQATMTEAEEATYQKLVDRASEAADKVAGLEGVVNAYQDATDKLADDTEQIAENIRKIEDAQIDLFQIASKTVDTFKELKENANWLEGYYSGLKSDSPFRALGEDLANLGDLIDSTTDKGEHFFNEMISKAQEAGDKAAIDFWTDAKNEAKKQIGDGTSILDMRQFYLQKLLSPEGRNLYGSNEKQWYEDLKEAYDNIIGDLKDIESKYESTLKDILDCYDDIADRMEFRNDQLEYQLDLLDAQRDLTETLHGEDSYGAFLILDAANVAGTLQQVKQIRGEYDYWVKRRDQYDKETQKDLWEAMDEQVRNFGEKLSDATQDAADAMAQQYEDATEKIVQDFRNKLFGKDSLGQADLFESEWEMAKDKADQYLDSVERSYELEKLRAKYQKMLDNTNDLGVQNKIKAAMDEQLKALENQKKAIINNQGELEYVNALSQFDVDLANAKVEALQKQIALEEAQRNKNQMQLRRDTQGNYRYVYRANEEDLAQAQEELTDSDYEIYEMSKERYSDVLNERWALQQEYEEKVRQANERYRNDEEAHKRALAEINDWYVERQVNLGLELQDAQAGMIEGVQHLAEDTTDYVSQTFEDISAAMLDNWTDTLGDIGVATSATLQDLTTDVEDFRDNVDEVWDLAVEAVQTFSNEVGELETSAGAAFTNVDTCVENVTSSLDDAAQSAKEFMDIINADTGGIDDAVIRLQSYEREISQTKDSASALATALKQAQDELDAKTREAQNYKTIIEQAKAGTHDLNGKKIEKPAAKSGGSSSGGGRNPSQYEKEGIAAAIWNGGYGWGAGDERKRKLEEKGFSYSEIQSIVNIGYERANAWVWANGWPDAYAYWKYDTGGYTGNWNSSEGKVAMLHQKELVLNAADTENMLAAVNIVREIVNTLKGAGAASSFLSLGSMTSNSGNNVQQRVEITAEFPNVDTADDIREALLSLADNAYQYAYKNK